MVADLAVGSKSRMSKLLERRRRMCPDWTKLFTCRVRAAEPHTYKWLKVSTWSPQQRCCSGAEAQECPQKETKASHRHLVICQNLRLMIPMVRQMPEMMRNRSSSIWDW